MVQICLEIKLAAVQPALPRNVCRAPQPVGSGKVQPCKGQSPCVPFFKIKPQIYGREKHAQCKIFVAGIVHAHKALGRGSFKGSAHIKRKGKPPRKPLVGHGQQAPQGGRSAVPAHRRPQGPLHMEAR